MRKALYRQHRPKKLDEVVGQEHITTTLKNAIKTGAISHAYLFTGPKGVGKTSIARILAHEINDLEYTDDQIHLDIIEIDAASNRRIDEIRELRDKVHIAPTSAKFKVYIIDEVHMLTREAFNALLKTLEEPPAHVVFILATTEAHKVPETIASRTQRFSFRAVPDKALANHLADIAKKEKISVEPAALDLIAAHGQGSFRDSIGLLDQLSGNGGKINETVVRQIIGLPAEQQIEQLLQSFESGDVPVLVSELQDLRTKGIAPTSTSKLLAERLRNELVYPKLKLERSSVLSVLEALALVPAHPDPVMALELALLKHMPETGRKNEPVFEEPAPTPPEPESDPEPETAPQPKIKAPPGPAKQESKSKPAKNDTEAWLQVLAEAKRAHNTLYGVLRMAHLKKQGKAWQLGFKFPFHAKQISSARNLNKVQELMAASFGGPVEVLVAVTDDYEEPLHSVSTEVSEVRQESPAEDPAVSSITNIFGSVEVLD